MMRDRRRSSAALVVVTGVAAAMSGCASQISVGAGASPTSMPPVASAPPTQAGTATFEYLGAITAPEAFTRSGIVLSVPDSASVPIVGLSAVDVSCASGEAICASGAAAVTLARATSKLAGTASESGILEPLMKDTLVYVVRWTGVPCAPTGGPARSTSGTSGLTTTCELVDFLDAQTGKVLYAIEATSL